MLTIKDFKLDPTYSIEELILNKQLFFAKNGKPIIIYNKWKNEKKLEKLMSTLLFYTSFLEESKFLLSLRFHCIENNLINYPICECGKLIKKNFNGVHFNKFCSQNCANKYTNSLKEGVYGKEMSEKIWKTRRENGHGTLSIEHKDKLSKAHKTKETQEKFKQTCLKKYGVENPGVLGAYSSKSGEKYIREFLNDRNISEKRCYFKNGGINNKEYFQMIYDESKQKHVYFSYDLIIFKNEDLKEIELVFEYNGPWHYNKEDVLIDPNGPSIPYKTNKLTKKETYIKDKLKLDHINCDNILIYWEKSEKLQKYEKCY